MIRQLTLTCFLAVGSVIIVEKNQNKKIKRDTH